MPLILFVFDFASCYVVVYPQDCFGDICIGYIGSIPQTYFEVQSQGPIPYVPIVLISRFDVLSDVYKNYKLNYVIKFA